MSAVAKTLWFIEMRLREHVSLEELAVHAGLSRFHLSRTFATVTGSTISAYLRGRRLTEAARALEAGAPDILQLALEFGYGSHEAFTRAFGEQFGLSPEELRRRGTLDNLKLVESLRMDKDLEHPLAPPVIETRPALHLAGLQGHYDMTNMGSIPDQWARFEPYIMSMVTGPVGDTFGICGVVTDEGFDYACAIDLAPGLTPHNDLTLFHLPATRYARFRHEGHISTVRATCAAIFSEWLPGSGETQDRSQFNFLEYYSPAFDPAVGIGGVEIWVALAPRP